MKELLELTGVGMMDCKRALTETGLHLFCDLSERGYGKRRLEPLDEEALMAQPFLEVIGSSAGIVSPRRTKLLVVENDSVRIPPCLIVRKQGILLMGYKTS